jgi:hypothetical protein
VKRLEPKLKRARSKKEEGGLERRWAATEKGKEERDTERGG